MQIAIEVLVILLLLTANGILAMSEIAVVSARKPRLQRRAEAGDAGPRRALELANDPNRFLSTVQIGITLSASSAGAFGGATIAQQLPAGSRRPSPRPLRPAAGHRQCRRACITYADAGHRRAGTEAAGPDRTGTHLRPHCRAHAPAVPPGDAAGPAARRVHRTRAALLPVREPDEPAVTTEDVRTLLEQGTRAGVFLAAEQDIVENVFWLGDQRVSSVMTPGTRSSGWTPARRGAAAWGRCGAARRTATSYATAASTASSAWSP
jgi:putative hemolysin